MIAITALAAVTLAVGATRTVQLVRTDGYRRVPARWQ